MFLKFCVAQGYPGIDHDVLQFFRSIKIPSNTKGTAVRTHHPTKGPFTNLEWQGIILAARETYRIGDVSKQDFTILLTLVATGSRPGQISMLVCGDLLPKGLESHTTRLLVPSLKKRTRKRVTRERVIPSELAILLQELVDDREGDKRFQGIPPGQRPIFAVNGTTFPSLEEAHIGSNGVGNALKRIQKVIGLRSARTGAAIVLSPRRFRSTLGTRAAEAGVTPIVIADLLDHADLQHVGVYIESRPSIVDRMDAALNDRIEPLAGLFKGAVVTDEMSSGVEDAGTRRIAAEASSNIGTCGGPKSCTRRAPFACYTCAAFRPWVDAPHEELLHYLANEREALIASGVSPQVATANDATMMAVAEVATRCRTMQGQHDG